MKPPTPQSDLASPTLRDVVWPRLRNQHLTGPRLGSAPAVVAWFGAVQSQDYLGAKWAVGQRARGDSDARGATCSDADVEEAFRTGAILRTHVMRPTWHFVAPADIRWLLALTAPRVHATNSPYYRKTGLDERAFARGNAALAKALQGGHHLTRDELRQVLRGAGLVADGLRLALLIMRAELDAVICSGPRRGKQFITYAALDERAPDAPTLRRDEALVALALRYFRSHGPARAQDFAWWSGLRVADAVAAIQMLGPALERRRIGEQDDWLVGATPSSAPAPPARAPRAGAPNVHLLPSYDEYLISFRDHSPVRRPDHRGALGLRGGVFATPVVILGGRIAGGWRRTLGRDQVVVQAKLLAPLVDAERTALEREAARYGRFLGLPVRLQLREPRRR